MVLGGEVLVDIAPAAYADAAEPDPVHRRSAFVMPALYRTVNQNVNVPQQAAAVHRRRDRRGAALHRRHLGAGAAEIGVYAAPIGMIVGFGVPALFLFIRGQRGKKPLFFPYREVGDRARCSRP